jgi:DNA-directed RNA polymerase specialized sigma24 family protein
MLDHVDRAQPGPDEKLAALEELQRLLQGLPDDLRRIVIWKLDGYTNAEIAALLDRTVRCVELKLQLIRKRLGSAPAAECTSA